MIAQVDNQGALQAHGALTFGLGSDGGYSLRNPKVYLTPSLVRQLPPSMSIPPSAKQTVDELATVTDYYDGSLNLNSITVNCVIFSNPLDCVHQSNCG